jgi:NADPH2:quinone reductase
MKAAYIESPGGPETLHEGELPDPHPGPGEVRLRNRAGGVGPWDVKAMSGRFGKLTMPYIVGFEFAGTVDALGEGVSGVTMGDNVFGTDWHAGSFAEYRIADPGAFALMPGSLSFAQAAALPVAGSTSLEGVVERLAIRAGESLVITAASGGVGTIAVQVAHNVGAHVVGVASSANRDYVLALGAREVVDYHDEDWPAQVRKWFPEGVDALFDCAGGDTLIRGFDTVRDGGRAVGIVYGGPDAAPRGIAFQRFSAASGRERMARIAEMADAGKLRVELAAELPLGRAREALELVAAGHTRGKVVVTID